MANLAQLQCFNKILLQKMKRMEFEHKKQLDKLKATYESLWDLTIEGGECVDMGLVHYCQGCDLWFNIEDEGVCGDDCGCCRCDTCKHDENTGIYDCYKCEDPICRNCNEFKMLDCCKECYLLEQYPLVGSDVFHNYDAVVFRLFFDFRQKHV